MQHQRPSNCEASNYRFKCFAYNVFQGFYAYCELLLQLNPVRKIKKVSRIKNTL